jgi:hypothetical protein
MHRSSVVIGTNVIYPRTVLHLEIWRNLSQMHIKLRNVAVMPVQDKCTYCDFQKFVVSDGDIYTCLNEWEQDIHIQDNLN